MVDICCGYLGVYEEGSLGAKHFRKNNHHELFAMRHNVTVMDAIRACASQIYTAFKWGNYFHGNLFHSQGLIEHGLPRKTDETF